MALNVITGDVQRVSHRGHIEGRRQGGAPCLNETSPRRKVEASRFLIRDPTTVSEREGLPPREISTISKFSFLAPHSGQVQLIGTSSQRVPGAMPSSGSPADSS